MHTLYRRAAFVVGLFTLALFCAAMSPQRVPVLLIVPFPVTAGENMDYLSQGLAAMLAPRIGTSGSIRVIDGRTAQGSSGAASRSLLQNTLALGRRMKADFILHGTIAARGGTIGIEARVVEVRRPQNSFPVSLQAGTLDRLIPEADRMAARIREIIMPVSEPYGAGDGPGPLEIVTPGRADRHDARTGGSSLREETLHDDDAEPDTATAAGRHRG